MTKISESFRRSEFACKCGCGLDAVDVELVDVLEDVKLHFAAENIGTPVYIELTSGNRCRRHNKDEGGAENSQHINCIAADFKVWLGWHQVQVPPDKVATYLEHRYPDRYGIGRYHNRTHADMRRQPARWSVSA